jgi:hypothetical protein
MSITYVTGMADNAMRPELLVNLTAALGYVARACGLPHGWVATPSFRITPQGASLQVVWSTTPAARAQPGGKEVKKKRKSKSSRQRSADRAALHKARKKPPATSQQALDPAAKSFSPNPIPVPPAPNSAPAAGQPAAEGSERVEGRIEGQSLVSPVVVEDRMVRLSGPTESVNAADRGKRKKVENTEERAEVRRLCEGLFERWSNGREESQYAFSLRDQLDRLRGPGTTRSLYCDWAEEARKSRQRMQGNSG